MGQETKYDVLIIGAGPAGLSAALALGRARKRVLLADFGPRRNAAAIHIHNFVTRDGTPPADFRRVGREQLATYPNVQIREVGIDAITGTRGAFRCSAGAEVIEAKRVLICTGMIDDVLPIEGFRELWGKSIFQCPYCHGWEVQDRAWGYIARAADIAHVHLFALQASGWTHDFTVYTNADAVLPEDAQSALKNAGIKIENTRIARLAAKAGALEAVELEDGRRIPCEILYAHPPQRQVALVTKLGLTLEPDGFVKVDPMRKETSIPGIYAAGDLLTRMQSAILAAGAGTVAATMINLDLGMERASVSATLPA